MKRVVAVSAGVLMMLAIPALCQAQSTASSGLPVSLSIYDRTRVDTWQWFAAPPKSETYAYVESLLRLAWLSASSTGTGSSSSQPAVSACPNDAVSPVTRAGATRTGRDLLRVERQQY